MESRPAIKRRGPTLIEMSVALAALIISVVTLFIAVRQTQVMDRQLAASVWPAMQYSTSNLRGGERVITLSIENVGVGPARIRDFSVKHNGKDVKDPTTLIRECCAGDVPFRTITSYVVNRIIPPGQEVDILTLPFDSAHPEIFEKFNRVRNELKIRLCFCSVLDDCWTVESGRREPEAVASCKASEN